MKERANRSRLALGYIDSDVERDYSSPLQSACRKLRHYRKSADCSIRQTLSSCRIETIVKTIEQTTDEILNLAATHFKVPRTELHADDDFFKKLGSDSLQALELLPRLENHFGVELPDYEVAGVSDFRTLATRIQARL